MVDLRAIIDELRRVDEQLRDLAYERLRDAAGDSDDEALADSALKEEARLLRARRAVARAISALGGADDTFD